LGVSNVFMSVFTDEYGQLPPLLPQRGWESSFHRPTPPGVPTSAPLYHCRPIQAHGLNICEVRVEIPFGPTAPWTRPIIGSEIDDTIEKMAHVALTSLCERILATTAAMSIALFSIHDQGDPMWQQCLTVVSDTESPHFSTSWVEMAKYSRYLFNLQHNTSKTIIEQHRHLNMYEEHATFRSCKMEMLRHENAILHREVLQSSD
jgi:hypothetical protein